MNIPVADYCHGSTVARAAMENMAIRTLSDLFKAIADDVAGYAKTFPPDGGVYKRHVLSFFKHKCRGIHVDFASMVRDKVIQMGGAYPDQWMVLQSVRPRVKQAPSDTICLSEWNGTNDDAAAMELALRRSLETPTLQKQDLIDIDGPIELCCPLSLMLFKDPVQTIRGETYERDLINAWFEKHNTDPMTGDVLLTTVLYDDCDMRERCVRYRACATS